MDSLTQIVLGAGVGELILGRKLGNRAMVWGAIAATIPDLDVLSGPWLSPAESLHAHRGFSHSVFFALMAPALYAFLLRKLYGSGINLEKPWKWMVAAFTVLGFLFMMAFPGFLGWYFGGNTWGGVILLIGAVAVYFLGNRFIKNYLMAQETINQPSFREWYWFFFWATFTHPILDCFTVYGTQLFAPISDVRISWDNIAVADPAYTLFYGIPLIVAAFYARMSRKRFVWMVVGLGLSSLYMDLTLHHKHKFNKVVEKTIQEEGIEVIRYMTNPAILSNLLWTTTIESRDTIYFGTYSVFDKVKRVKLTAYAKNRALLSEVQPGDYDIETIQWFSKGYYTAITRSDRKLQLNDMRYGTFGIGETDENSYIFRFILDKDQNGFYHIDENSQRPPDRDMRAGLRDMFHRIKHQDN